MNSAKQSAANAIKQRHILVVDSDPQNLSFLESALSAHYDRVVVDSGAKALETIYGDREALQLVLYSLDLRMANGRDVLKQIGEDPLLMRVPIIAMGHNRREEAESLNAGAMDFFFLPGMLPEAALARVRHVIEISRNRNIIRSTECDQLTGLYSKEYFFNYVEQYDGYHPDFDMDAIVLNISHFHMINERYGKAYGDEVLKFVAAKLRAYLSDEGGILSRSDADSFMIYCPHRWHYEDIAREAASGMDSRVRMRMGVYANVDKKLEIERRFDRAKQACDTLRDSYTKSVAIYDDLLRQREIYVEQLLDDFPDAIAQKQFVVYYQPKFAIQSTMPLLNSAEALVRWNHPKLGIINPGNFVPLFEHNGLIRQLDSYVWREVARQMRDWKDRLDFCLPVSVNVSRVDMFDNDLVDSLKALMDEFGLSTDEFLLEITESAYTQDSNKIIETVKQLREAGFHIEIDDFGSGYSSLNMISTLPMDALKLDMEFMHNAFKERKNTKMLDAVIDIAYSLGVPTIAEGVETAEQMFALKEMGCDVVQGYYFSQPVPAEEYECFLLERKNGRDGGYQDRTRAASIKAAEQFAYEALHDPLTGLFNHSAYKILLKDADQRNIALLLADIDNYPDILKHQGQETADHVVELVADTLRHNFRSVDFICRIGADEFAVIVTRVNSDMKQLMSEKAQRIDRMISEHRGLLPGVSLSIGVAFADRENPQGDIFHDADIALNRIKEKKASNWMIY